MNKQVLYITILYLLLLTSCSKTIVAFDAFTDDNEAPTRYKFENKSLNADFFIWNFGDGQKSEEVSPYHRYLNSGVYTVKLYAMRGKKVNTIEKKIKVLEPSSCIVEIETNYGNMTIKLFDETPLHRDNFLKLVEKSFYNGTLFHRVINGFMIQAGDPDSKFAPKGKRIGGGGPGYEIKAEIVDSFYHIKGMVAAARVGDDLNPLKSSSGSQFYIVQGRPVTEKQLEKYELDKDYFINKKGKSLYQKEGGTPQLDKEYTIFGQVIYGLNVLDKIASVKTDNNDRPEEDIKIINIKVIK